MLTALNQAGRQAVFEYRYFSCLLVFRVSFPFLLPATPAFAPYLLPDLEHTSLLPHHLAGGATHVAAASAL